MAVTDAGYRQLRALRWPQAACESIPCLSGDGICPADVPGKLASRTDADASVGIAATRLHTAAALLPGL